MNLISQKGYSTPIFLQVDGAFYDRLYGKSLSPSVIYEKGELIPST